jgi:ligand-binding sensor domain-containing protein/serine phosphatase RsbU (regulator of sigma subunit)
METLYSTMCLQEDKEGNIWFGTYNGGIYKYRISDNRMEKIDLLKAGLSSNWVSCLTEDSKGRMWAGTFGGGIAVIDGANIRKFDENNGLKATRIYDIIEDVEGNILIADQNNGITIYKGDAFENINEKDILPHPNVNAIYQDKSGAIWFGTNAGISRYYPGSGKPPVIYNKAGNSINEDIRFFKEDSGKNLWIGANEAGVIMYNMKASKFEAQPYINSNLYRGGKVTAMEIDKKNNLWIGTVDGVAVGTINEQNFRRYTLLDSLNVSLITALYCDPNGDMWIGTEPRGNRHCLIKYNASENIFKAVLALAPGIIPTTMAMDKKGILWIGTGDGLIALRNDSILTTLTQDDGLLSNVINLLAIGDNGSIYIGTNNGLNRYFPETKRIFSYTERNGFTGIETMPNAVYRSPEGDLWFGTSNGATRLRPEKLVTEGSEPMTHIMDMRVNNEARKMIPGMKLKFSERNIIFDYYSICLTNPDVVRFKVRLDGAEDNWRPVTDQTRAIYSALPPGKFTFNVIACNNQGIWNSKPVAFHFIIRPPFYLTWWFILISVAIISFIVVIFIRTQNLVRDKKILEIKVKERTSEIEQQKKEIEENRDLVTRQKEHIEEIHKEVTDSINYAKRIQTSSLPDLKLLDNYFSDRFLLFKPKDVVSGDFYWLAKVEDRIVVTVADCTGHGVPGAFMSMLGISLLKEIVVKEYITQPDVILKRLRKEIIKALGQTGISGEQKDGMDISLCSINTETYEMQWSGANNPCLIVRKGELIELKADKMPIAIYDNMSKFSLHEINLQKNDIIYLASDGYSDQFGGPENKKFMSLRFRELLLNISDKPMSVQKVLLDETIEDWKNGKGFKCEQTDDITVMGIKIS